MLDWSLPTLCCGTFALLFVCPVVIYMLLHQLVARWRYRTPAEVRAARRLRGLCPECGYDTRATPARCPECGTTL